ncbi:MAG TPA: DUF167 domain-containing protein [Abditibacteriaceae bacterium]|nr:DUF167 domain-containing protein [Abditibacteriaceae bacterium]
MPESQVEITAGQAGALLPVRVKPRGRANAIEGVRHGMLLVSVTAAPADGAANAAVIEVLAAACDCAKSRIRIERGLKAREKVVCLDGLSPQEVRARLK